MLAELEESLKARGIDFRFAEMKDPVKDKLKRFGLCARLGEDAFFATLGEAVDSYVEVSHIAWSDWKDEERASSTKVP
jgi:hypothetical protein